MDILIFIGGVITGSIISIIFKGKNETHGVIDVDHNLEVCFVNVTSKDLMQRRTKRAVFKINHDADLSRQEQVL